MKSLSFWQTNNKDKNVQETEKWLKQLIKNNKEETGIPIDGDTSYMTLKAYKYVQDAIIPEISWADLSTKHIYICGSSAMGKGVLDIFIKYRMDVLSSTYQEASKYWADRAKEKSFLREIWG